MSGRGASASVQAAAAAGTVVPVVFVELHFPAETSRLTNAGISIQWNGFTWLGAGAATTIDTIGEGLDPQSRGLAFTLSGVATNMLSYAIGAPYRNGTAQVWVGLLDPQTYAVVDSPVVIWVGQMDVMTPSIEPSASTVVAAIRLECESRMALWARSKGRRYTHEDQQLDYPGDKFFEFIPRLQEAQLPWGRS